jgi:hypothetical protein
LLVASLVAGCQQAELGSARQTAMFVLTPAMPAAEAATLHTVRLHGKATVPTRVRDLANVQDGLVSGSPVAVRDVATGRSLAEGVTYYDGSFMVDVPLAGSARAVVVTLDLVERSAAGRTAALQAPVMLRAGIARMDVTLSPGTTALTAFLSRLAVVQAPTAPAIGEVEREFGSLIAVFEPEAQTTFARMAESAPEIRQADSLAGFETGIQAYVGRLTSKSETGAKQASRPATGATDGL